MPIFNEEDLKEFSKTIFTEEEANEILPKIPELRTAPPISRLEQLRRKIFERPAEQIAYAQNIWALSQQTKIPLHVIREHYQKLARDPRITGIKPTDISEEEYKQLLSTPVVIAGLVAEPVPMLSSIATFHILDKLIPTEKFIPSDISDDWKALIELIDFIGKGAIAGQVYKRAPWVTSPIFERFTKQKIVEYNLPKTVRLSAEQVKDIYQSGTLTPPELQSLFASLNLSRDQLRTALQRGIDIEIPAEKFIRVVDKPFWAKLKSYFRAQPYEKVISEPRPIPTFRFPEAPKVAPPAVTAPPPTVKAPELEVPLPKAKGVEAVGEEVPITSPKEIPPGVKPAVPTEEQIKPSTVTEQQAQGKLIAPSEYFVQTDEGLIPIKTRTYPLTYKTINMFAHRDIINPKLWVITNKETGLQIATGNTQKEAIQNALRRIDEYGIEKTLQLLETHKAKIVLPEPVKPKIKPPEPEKIVKVQTLAKQKDSIIAQLPADKKHYIDMVRNAMPEQLEKIINTTEDPQLKKLAQIELQIKNIDIDKLKSTVKGVVQGFLNSLTEDEKTKFFKMVGKLENFQDRILTESYLGMRSAIERGHLPNWTQLVDYKLRKVLEEYNPYAPFIVRARRRYARIMDTLRQQLGREPTEEEIRSALAKKVGKKEAQKIEEAKKIEVYSLAQKITTPEGEEVEPGKIISKPDGDLDLLATELEPIFAKYASQYPALVRGLINIISADDFFSILQKGEYPKGSIREIAKILKIPQKQVERQIEEGLKALTEDELAKVSTWVSLRSKYTPKGGGIPAGMIHRFLQGNPLAQQRLNEGIKAFNLIKPVVTLSEKAFWYFGALPRMMADWYPEFKEVWDAYHNFIELNKYYNVKGLEHLKDLITLYDKAPYQAELVRRYAMERTLQEKPYATEEELKAYGFNAEQIAAYNSLVDFHRYVTNNYLLSRKALLEQRLKEAVTPEDRARVQEQLARYEEWANDFKAKSEAIGYMTLTRAPLSKNPYVLLATFRPPEVEETFDTLSPQERAKIKEKYDVYYHFKDRKSLNKAVQDLEKRGARIIFQGTAKEWINAITSPIPTPKWTLYRRYTSDLDIEMIIKEKDIKITPEVQKIIDYIQERSLPPFLLPREKVGGWQYFDMEDWMASLLRLNSWTAYKRAIEEFRAILPEITTKITDPDIKEYTRIYLDNIFANESRLLWLNLAITGYALGTRLSWLATEGLQTFWNLAENSSQIGITDGTKIWVQTFEDTLKYLLKKGFPLPDKIEGIPQDILEFVKELDRRGLGQEAYIPFVVGKRKIPWTIDLFLTLPTKKMERFLRTKSLFDIARILKQKDPEFSAKPEYVEKVMPFVRDYISRTQMLYEHELPVMVEQTPLLDIFYRFFITTTRMAHVFMRSGWQALKEPKDRWSNFRRFLILSLFFGFFAGMRLMPGFWLWKKAYRAKTKRNLEDDIKEWAETLGGKEFAEMMAKGPFTYFTGVDMGPQVTLLDYPAILAYGRPAVVGFYENIKEGWKDIANGDYLKALERLTPSAFTGLLQVLEWIKEGGITKGGAIYYTPTAEEMFIRALSFMPARIRELYNKMDYIKYVEEFRKRAKSNLVKLGVRALERGDALNHVYKMAEQYNEDIRALGERYNLDEDLVRGLILSEMELYRAIVNRKKRKEDYLRTHPVPLREFIEEYLDNEEEE